MLKNLIIALSLLILTQAISVGVFYLAFGAELNLLVANVMGLVFWLPAYLLLQQRLDNSHNATEKWAYHVEEWMVKNLIIALLLLILTQAISVGVFYLAFGAELNLLVANIMGLVVWLPAYLLLSITL